MCCLVTRRMADSVNALSLPVGFDLYAGYVNGRYNNYAQIVQRFPNKPVIGISVSPTADIGTCLDVEQGDARPEQAPAWVEMRRQAKVIPWVYCSEAIWSQCIAEFTTQKVPQPLWWIAAYPGAGAVLYPGSIAHQWIDHGPYDESVVADYIPGVDPQPVPVLKGEDMIASTPSGNGYWVCKPDGSIWSYGDAQYLNGLNYPTQLLSPGDQATGFAAYPGPKQGYWISTATGAVFAFGAAGYHGGPNVP